MKLSGAAVCQGRELFADDVVSKRPARSRPAASAGAATRSSNS